MLATKPNDFVRHRKRPKSTTPPPQSRLCCRFCYFTRMITERNRKMRNGWNLFGNSALRLTKVNLQEAHRPVLKEHKHTFFF